uniref:Uncharacterized protein n=1 Tax=Arion vulgaris TaxID=1028688 RepID=A0A0B6ZI77_9EUPU
MGWQNSTMFKDCYKPTFLATMAKPSSRCLYSDSGVQTQVFSFKDNKLVNADKSISNTLGN